MKKFTLIFPLLVGIFALSTAFASTGSTATGDNQNTSGTVTTGIVTTGTVNTGTVTTGTVTTGAQGTGRLEDKNKTGYYLVKTTWKELRINFDNAKRFLVHPLTGQVRKSVNKIFLDANKALRALVKQTRNLIKAKTPVDRTGYVASGTTIINNFKTAILPYIATNSGNLDKFNAYIAKTIEELQKSAKVKEVFAKKPKKAEKEAKKIKEEKRK